MGSIYYPRDGYVTYEHEFILLFRKAGKARRPPAESREKSRLSKIQRSEWFRGIWEIHPARQDDHPAMFPLELPERLIRMFSYFGETVIDPFVGSGTTLEAARKAGRCGIGIELNPKFVPLARARVSDLTVQGADLVEAVESPRGTAQLRRQSPQPEQAVGSRAARTVDCAVPAK